MAIGTAVVLDRLLARGKSFFPREEGYTLDCQYDAATMGYDVRASYGLGVSAKYMATAYLDESMFIQDDFNNDLIIQQFQSLSWSLHNYMIVRERHRQILHWVGIQPGVHELMGIAGVEIRTHHAPVLGRQYWLVKPEKWAVNLPYFYDGGTSVWSFEMWQEYIAAQMRREARDERVEYG